MFSWWLFLWFTALCMCARVHVEVLEALLILERADSCAQSLNFVCACMLRSEHDV
jgi:hypothetical protein